MSLKRQRVTSNASRNILIWTSKWYDRSIPKKLSYRRKSKSGRCSLTGRIVVWTKSSFLHRIKLLRTTYRTRCVVPSFVSTLKLVPFSNKLLALVVSPSGSFSYLPAIDTTKVFSLVTFRYKANTGHTTFKTSHYSLIYALKAFRKISNLEVSPGVGVQYARSAGCWAKITKFDYFHHTAMIKLPSGVRKFFSLYSIGAYGPSALKLKRKLKCTKSGSWRSFGVKPKVRGVARNPVDHPHGGRTKSIKYPRTPWGKTTKFK